MDEEGYLPPLKDGLLLRSIVWDEEYGTFSNNYRKRARAQHVRRPPSVFSNSSDPAVFSSDDDASIDNYIQGRRKKRYVGSWFQQHPASLDAAAAEMPGPRPKRVLTRQLDSGVYMGSDDLQSDSIMPEELPLPKLQSLDSPARPRIITREENLAERKVKERVDRGEEIVDLSSMQLESISNEALVPLSEFSTIPLVTKGVPFEQKDPELKLYLSANYLSHLPRTLFDVEHLTTLTLRNNKLTELPPAIGKLRNLRDLNIAHNYLRYLPGELLDLISDVKKTKLNNLLLHPNPFLQPECNADLNTTVNELLEGSSVSESGSLQRTARSAFHPAFSWLRSPVEFSDTHGTVYSEFQLKDASNPLPVAPEHEAAPPIHGRHPSPTLPTKVPSLLDVALRAAYGSQALPHLSSYFEGYDHLESLLDRLAAQKESGEMRCASCKTPLVTAKTMWLEWWGLTRMHSRELTPNNVEEDGAGQVWRHTLLNPAPEETLIPFVRRGCSWRCLPQKLKPGAWYHDHFS